MRRILFLLLAALCAAAVLASTASAAKPTPAYITGLTATSLGLAYANDDPPDTDTCKIGLSLTFAGKVAHGTRWTVNLVEEPPGTAGDFVSGSLGSSPASGWIDWSATRFALGYSYHFTAHLYKMKAGQQVILGTTKTTSSLPSPGGCPASGTVLVNQTF